MFSEVSYLFSSFLSVDLQQNSVYMAVSLSSIILLCFYRKEGNGHFKDCGCTGPHNINA